MSRSCIAAIVFLAIGCSHAVRIVTVPSGAEVWINRKAAGTAPLIFKERSGIFGRRSVLEAKWPNGAKAQTIASVKVCPTPANLLMNSIFVGLIYGFCLQDEYVLEADQGRS